MEIYVKMDFQPTIRAIPNGNRQEKQDSSCTVRKN